MDKLTVYIMKASPICLLEKNKNKIWKNQKDRNKL
jgi:hypothetical protein